MSTSQLEEKALGHARVEWRASNNWIKGLRIKYVSAAKEKQESTWRAERPSYKDACDWLAMCGLCQHQASHRKGTKKRLNGTRRLVLASNGNGWIAQLWRPRAGLRTMENAPLEDGRTYIKWEMTLGNWYSRVAQECLV